MRGDQVRPTHLLVVDHLTSSVAKGAFRRKPRDAVATTDPTEVGALGDTLPLRELSNFGHLKRTPRKLGRGPLRRSYAHPLTRPVDEPSHQRRAYSARQMRSGELRPSIVDLRLEFIYQSPVNAREESSMKSFILLAAMALSLGACGDSAGGCMDRSATDCPAATPFSCEQAQFCYETAEDCAASRECG